MPYTLMLYPAAPSIPLSLIAGTDPSTLQMHPAASGYQIDTNSIDPNEVQRALMATVPGQFVTVPIVYADRLDTVYLQVQPHLWGAWSILFTEDPDTDRTEPV